MTAQPAAGDDARRRRALALMGIDVYRLRGAPEPPAVEAPATATPPSGPRAADILRDLPGTKTRVRVALDAAAGDPRTGPHAALLAALVRALGVAPLDVAYGDGADDVPLLCFGVAPPPVPNAHGFAPLASVRAGAAVKRSLWRDLRRLRRRLSRG